jgi:hypothetical protein
MQDFDLEQKKLSLTVKNYFSSFFISLCLFIIFLSWCIYIFVSIFKGNDPEVKFHEIKFQLFQETVLFLIMRSNFFAIFREVKIPNNDLFSSLQHFSWDRNCLILLLPNTAFHDQFVSCKYDHEIKSFYAQMAN